MDKAGQISRIMVVAASSARRAALREVTSRALRGRAHITSDSHISQEKFTTSESAVLIADLDTAALTHAIIDFLVHAPAGSGAVALIDDPEPAWVRTALGASINAILARDAGPDDLLLAIEAAAAGLVLLHPTSVRGLVTDSYPAPGDAPTSDSQSADFQPNDDGFAEELTGRECQVLRLVSAGFGNKEIAAQLALSEHTVKFHISSILGKLNVASRTEAVTLGIRRGLIPI